MLALGRIQQGIGLLHLGRINAIYLNQLGN